MQPLAFRLRALVHSAVCFCLILPAILLVAPRAQAQPVARAITNAASGDITSTPAHFAAPLVRAGVWTPG